MTQYGGTGSQDIDHWMGFDYWWYQMLASRATWWPCVDNQGTGGRGEEFKK